MADSSNQQNLKFFFDIEATGLQKGSIERVLFQTEEGRQGYIDDTSYKRGSIPQIIQFFGEFADGSGAYDEHARLDVEKINELYSDLEVEFKPTGESEYITNQKIAQLYEDSATPAQIKLRKKIEKREGDFRISPNSRNALKSLIQSKGSNNTPGTLPLSASVIGSTMNKILASNVFEAKFGRPQEMKSTEQLVSDLLVKLENKSKNVSGNIELSGWNVTYDMEMLATNIDEYGSIEDKQRWKRLFGDRINSDTSTIKVVDEMDKLKDIQFLLLQENENYNVYNFNKRNAESDLLKGGNAKEVILNDIKENLRSNRSGNYLNEFNSLKNLALETKISKTKTEADIKSVFAERVQKHIGRIETGSVEEKIVSVAATMVKELGQIDHSNPSQNQGATEIMRRHVRAIGHSKKSANTLNYIFNSTGDGPSLLGIAKDYGIEAAPDGSLRQSVLEFKARQASGLDMIFGHTLGSGDGGLLNAFISAGRDYGETLRQQERAPSDQLKGVFTDLEKIKQNFDKGGMHDARIDVRNTANLVTKLFQKHLAGEMASDVQEFTQLALKNNLVNSAQSRLDGYIVSTEIDNSLLHKMGNALDSAMPGQAQIDISSSVQGGEATFGDEARSTFEKVKGGIPKRGGALAKAALITSGLLLIGNTNGDIKSPGSRHNILEGVSPSGDALIHSFGSGNDSYSNQALNNLTYNFNLGSETLRSSMLGYKGDRLYDMLLGKQTFTDYTRSADRGNIIHSIIEQEYMSKGLAQAKEHFVYSSELDVVGHVDLILNSGVPLEIKSVEDFEALKELSSPKERHVSQANFYAYALKQPYAIIGYAARNDPTKVKYFKINTDIKRVMRDVSTVRAASSDLRRQGHDVVTYSAHKYMSDLYLQLTQKKYAQNAVGQATALAPGMLASPEDYQGYSAIKALGDYSRFIKKLVWRQERKANLTNTLQYKGKSKIRNQGKHADLHGNTTLKYNQRESGYHNRSRAMNYSGA